MLGNLTGWHLLIGLSTFAVLATVAVVIVLVAIRLSRKRSLGGVDGSLPDPADQILKLARLREQGLLSETEYEAKRQELMRRI